MRRVVLAIAAQGVSALSNVIVALVVARALGPDGFGTFTLLVATLIFCTSIQSAWVGDYLTVAGVADVDQRAVRSWQSTLAMAGAVVGVAVAWVFADVGGSSVLAFALLTYAWLEEEFGRRFLMAEQRFLAQAGNDALYLVVTVVALIALQSAGWLTLTTALLAMTLGAVSATVDAARRMPRALRWRLLAMPARRQSLRDIASFGAWRAAQTGTGAATQFAYRRVVVAGASLAALANLELSRILVGPLMVAVGGLGNALLPAYAAAAREGRKVTHGRIVLALLVPISIYAVVAVVWAQELGVLLAGEAFHVQRSAVVGWLLLSALLTISQPVLSHALVAVAPRTVFVVRGLAAVASLVLVWAMVAVAGISAVPFALCLAPLVSTLWLRWQVRRSAPGADR